MVFARQRVSKLILKHAFVLGKLKLPMRLCVDALQRRASSRWLNPTQRRQRPACCFGCATSSQLNAGSQQQTSQTSVGPWDSKRTVYWHCISSVSVVLLAPGEDKDKGGLGPFGGEPLKRSFSERCSVQPKVRRCAGVGHFSDKYLQKQLRCKAFVCRFFQVSLLATPVSVGALCSSSAVGRSSAL